MVLLLALLADNHTITRCSGVVTCDVTNRQNSMGLVGGGAVRLGQTDERAKVSNLSTFELACRYCLSEVGRGREKWLSNIDHELLCNVLQRDKNGKSDCKLRGSQCFG